MMTAILNRIHYVEYSFEEMVRHFIAAHPYIASMAFLIGIPLFIVMAVVVCTTVVMTPIGWLLGWM